MATPGGFRALLLLTGLVAGCARDAARPAPAGWPPQLVDLASRARERFEAPTLSVDEAADLQDKALVVDVRGANEAAVSRIPGAVLLADEAARDAFVKQPHDGPVLVYCTVGWRSGEYARRLADAGVQAFNLDGGICAWAAAGRPIVDAAGEPTRRIHAYSDDFKDCVPAGLEAVTTP